MSSGSSSGGSLNGLWWLGFIFSVSAQLVGIIGNQLVKYAHNQNEARSEERRIKSWKQPVWVTGMFMITVLNTSLNLAAFAFAAQSLLATFGSVSLLWNLIVAKVFTREKPSVFEYCGTVVALVGVTLCAVFGPRVTSDYNLSKLSWLYQQTPFVVYAVILAVWMAALFFLKDRNVPFKRFCNGAFPGCCGGLTALFSKSTVELIKSASRGGRDFSSPIAYAILGAAIASAVMQIVFLNRCLKRYDPLYVVPIYQSSLLLTSAVTGTIYFQDYKVQSAVSLALFPTGVAITLVALVIFGLHRAPNAHVIVPPADSETPSPDDSDPAAKDDDSGGHGSRDDRKDDRTVDRNRTSDAKPGGGASKQSDGGGAAAAVAAVAEKRPAAASRPALVKASSPRPETSYELEVELESDHDVFETADTSLSLDTTVVRSARAGAAGRGLSPSRRDRA